MNRRIGYLVLALIVLASLTIVGLTQLRGEPAPEFSADVVAALSGSDGTGFARATAIREFTFPADHGAHPEYQTEWWYNTANVATKDGRRFGLKFTIFRRALTPTTANMPVRSSEWATSQIYFADFAIADIAANQFYFRERFSRGAAGLAGAVTAPRVRIWIEDWAIEALDEGATAFRLRAVDGPIAMDVTIRQVKPIVLQGDRGLSAKSQQPGNASYYYSLTRLSVEGVITINNTTHEVSGTSWMDREWSTSVLAEDAVGWDWFALQLDDGREIMLYQIRKKDGGVESTSDGTLVLADGTTKHLTLEDYRIEPTGAWRSARTGAEYPSGWNLTISTPTGTLQLTVTPLMLDQELNTTTAYWEGASRITGLEGGKAISGYGYVELTGYNRALANRAGAYNRE